MSVDRINQNSAQITNRKMSVNKIADFMFQDEQVAYLPNFFMSGSYVSDNYDLLDRYFQLAYGKCPIFVFHHNTEIIDRLERKYGKVGENSNTNFYKLGENDSHYIYEPFSGMGDEQIVTVVHRLAKKLGYDVNSHFDSIIRCHLSIIRFINKPVNLSTLYMICKVRSLKDFHDYIVSQPDKTKGEKLFAALGLDKESRMEQYQLFRNVIITFAYEVEQSGWRYDSKAQRVNCLSTLNENKKNPILAFAINDTYSELFFNYLVDELRRFYRIPFVLILDNIKLEDKFFCEYVLHSNAESHIGLISENLPSYIKDEKYFVGIAEKCDFFMIFKHRTSSSAKSFSDLLGNYDMIMEQKTRGESQENFALIRKNIQTSSQQSINNRYRVMPEVIINLADNELCLFDAEENQIHFITIADRS